MHQPVVIVHKTSVAWFPNHHRPLGKSKTAGFTKHYYYSSINLHLSYLLRFSSYVIEPACYVVSQPLVWTESCEGLITERAGKP